MKYGLSDAQFDELIQILAAYPEIEAAVLFGSRALGTYKEASDVDIALKGAKVTAALAAKLKYHLEEETYQPFFYDFVAFPTITNEALKEHINSKGISVFRRGWREVALGEVILSANTGLDAIKRAPIVNFDSGLKCLRIQDVSQQKKYEEWGFTEVEHRNYQKFRLRENDILIARTGASIGVNLYINEDIKAVFNNGLIRLRAKKEICDPKYLFLNLRTAEYKSFIESISGGTSTQPNMQINALLSYEIFIPPLPEQKAIASVLSSLGDKIELLHRQNKSLEAMAETLFRQWFVEEAREEWENGKIEDLFILQRGFDLPVQKRLSGSHPIFAASGLGGYHNESKVKAPGVTTGRSGLLGKVFYIMEDFWPLNTSLFIKEFKAATPLFSYFYLKNIDLESFNAGSAVPTLNRNHVHEYNILIPPEVLINQFEELMAPVFHKIHYNRHQIQTLEKLRDTLLPKLMSGEVRVSF